MLPRPPKRKQVGKFPVVRYRSQEMPISEHDLEMGIRCGQIPLDSVVQYTPWTGKDFVPVWKVSQLKNACLAPYALVIDHLRQEVIPWASGFLFLLTMVAALLQFRGWFGNDILFDAALGWSNTWISWKWWTPWLSQLIHLEPLHALGNILILFYCAFRVERAFGFWTVLLTASVSLLFGTVAVLLLGQKMVVGSSVLVFGLWACQVAIGFRLAEILPREFRGLYGWGNFLLFVPLLMINIMSEDVSNLAHTGGIIGGALVGFLYSPDTMIPRKRRRPLRRIVHVLYAKVLLFAFISLGQYPGIVCFPEEKIDRKEAGVLVTLPERMFMESWKSMTVWKGAYGEETFFYADSFWLSTNRSVSKKDIKTWWTENLNTEVEDIDLKGVAKPGWTNFYFQTEDKIIWEQVHQQGKYLIRTGCTLRKKERQRLRFCSHWLNQVQIQEASELTSARLRYEQFSQTPEEAFSYGSLLFEFGQIKKADVIYKQAAYRNDKYRWQALYERLLLRMSNPEDFNWADDQIWMNTLFHLIPISQGRLFELAVRYANSNGKCNMVDIAWKRWSGLITVKDQAMHNLILQCRK
jgi:membrane associated rhomboid family serine protease